MARALLSCLAQVVVATVALGCAGRHHRGAPPEAAESPAPIPAAAPIVVVVVGGGPVTVVAPAAAAPAVPARWRGEWSTPTGYRCSFDLRLDADESGSVDGVIEWTLVGAPRGTSQARRIGRRGRERVRATYDPGERRLDLVGYDVDDPVLLVPDHYSVTLDPAGSTFEGRGRGASGLWSDAIRGRAVVDPP